MEEGDINELVAHSIDGRTPSSLLDNRADEIAVDKQQYYSMVTFTWVDT